MPQIRDLSITKTVAADSDFLLMQSPESGETYKITKANLLAGLSNQPQANLLLDGLNNVVAARSIRKLISSYSGNAIEVQSISGGATQNIGFSENNLDTTALNNFASSNSAYVKKIYGQVGVTAAQSDFSLCPKIVDAGNVIQAGGKPTLFYSNDFLEALIPSTYPLTIIAVVKISTSTNGAFIKCGSASTGVGIGVGNGTFDSNGLNLIGLNELIAWVPSNIAISTSTMAIVEVNATGSKTDVYLNGVLVASGGSSYAPSGTYNIGGYASRFPICSISEDIVFNEIISAATRSNLVANMASYYNIF